MKKILSFFLSLVVLGGILTVSPTLVDAIGNPFDESEEFSQMIAEGFEDGVLPDGISADMAELSIATTSNGSSKYALKVTPSDAHSVYFRFGGNPKAMYDFSFLTKDATAANMYAYVWFKTADGYSSQELTLQSTAVANGFQKHSVRFTMNENATSIGFLELVSYDTKTYLLDDVQVIPHYSGEVVKAGNLSSYSTFENEASLSGLSYNKNRLTLSIGEGYQSNGSMHVVSTGKGWANVSFHLPIRFGRMYKISFYAKANDSATAGKTVDFVIDRAWSKTDPAVPSWEQPYDPNHRTMTTSWTKYEITYHNTLDTYDKSVPSVYLRVGNASTDVLDYCVDNLEVYEVPNVYDVDAAIDANIDSFEENALNLLATTRSNSVGAWYRIYAPYGSEYTLYKSGYISNGEAIKLSGMPSDLINYKVEYNAVDAWGVAGATKYATIAPAEHVRTSISQANFQQSLWVNDMATVDASATVIPEKDTELFSGIALYDGAGKLLSVHTEQQQAVKMTQNTVSVAIDNRDDAVKAKFFTWEADSLVPVCDVKELNKSTFDEIIYVNPNSTVTSANGSFAAPYKTFAKARTKLQNRVSYYKRKNIPAKLCVALMPGTYTSESDVIIDNADAECGDDIAITYLSTEPGKAIFSGGKEITGFTLYDAEHNIYRARVTDEVAKYSRQMYVNGIRAVRARSDGGLADCVNLGAEGGGVSTSDQSFLSYRNISDLELVFYENWTNPRFKVESAILDQATGLVNLSVEQTLWTRRMNGNNCIPTTPVFYENAYELLDDPGEFYIDSSAGYVYYIPRTFEDMSTAQVVIPNKESILKVSGTADAPIRNITFDGISFAYATWLAPNDAGFADTQNNIAATKTTDGFIPGAVELTNVHNVDFYNCKFSKVGQTGVKFLEAIQNCDFVGNEIYDTSGGALFVGDPTWTHARAPKEEKYYQINNNFTDNYIHDIAVEYQGGAAVSAAFPKNTNICHNEIYNTAYSAIHTGWGWGSKAESGTINFKLNNNYIHHCLNTIMFDGASIYTLGHTGGSLDNLNEMCGNYSHDQGNKFGVWYPDEGSSYWLIDQNVSDQSRQPIWYGKGNSPMAVRWTHVHTESINNIVYGTNYTTTENHLINGTDIQYNKPEVYPSAAWPKEAKDIINNAGVRKEYRDNFALHLQEVTFPDELSVSVGATQQIDYIPTTGKMARYYNQNMTVSFVSDNPAVAAVLQEGAITGISPGTATITATFKENQTLRTFKFNITVS